MELKEIYQFDDCHQNKNLYMKNPKISFEVFPPKDGNISDLFDEVRFLKKYNPSLISLTFGANGGTRSLSLGILKMFIDLELNVMPHYTCVGSTKSDIEKYIVAIENMGIENILALRGDPLKDITFEPDFRYANELVEFIKNRTNLSIGVAGYPEGHIECENIHKDIENLKRKVDVGADVIFTQLFFNNDKFFKYVELVRNAGINVPIIPGIMPVRSLKQLDKMVGMARVEIPNKLRQSLIKFPNDSKKLGIEFAINQCQGLIDFGVLGLHFFTLNHSDQTSEILDNILF